MISAVYIYCFSQQLVCVEKCVVVTFARKRCPLVYGYALNGSTIGRKSCVTDLGVLLDEKLSFHDQLDHVVTEGNQLIGLLKQIARDITDPVRIKTLYCALVRPVLEYASVVWWPTAARPLARLESIQRKFTRFALRSWSVQLDYEGRCALL